MARVTKSIDYHIEITINDREVAYVITDRTDAEKRAIAKGIEAQIKRHVDLHGSDVQVISKHNDVCSFCGYRWTETTAHNGGCCDDDVALMERLEIAAEKARTA